MITLVKQRFSSRVLAIGNAIVLMSLSFATSFAGVAFAQGAPDSRRISDTLTQSGNQRGRWPAPATGGLWGESGDTYVLGSGSLGDPERNAVYNSAVTTWADKEFIGEIVNVDQGFWLLEAATCGYAIEASASYSGGPAVPGTFRAETTATAEMRGHFSGFTEYQVAVDSRLLVDERSRYDAVGGGNPPVTYANGGGYIAKPCNGFNRRNRAPLSFGVTVANQVHSSLVVAFWMYARGTQYLHCSQEPNARLGTNIAGRTSIIEGWRGTISSYEILGNGTVRIIRTHLLP